MYRYEKEVIYDVADIHGNGTIRRPDSLEFLKLQQDYREQHETNRKAPERYLYQGQLLVVEQKRLSPPCYQISLMFGRMKRLLYDLGLPIDIKARYFSKLIAGGDYAWAFGSTYNRYQRYSVEVVGLGMEPFPLTESNNRTKLPDSGQYSTPPQYWYESLMELVQIWRTRVFRSSSFTPSIANPLTPYRPTFPYLERCWHPNVKNITIDFRGTVESPSIRCSRTQFEIDAYNILRRSPVTSGRRASYESLVEFYCEVRKVYRLLAKKDYEPLRKEVVPHLKCSLTTFNKYWSKTELHWRDCHDLFMADLLPTQIANLQFD